MTEKQIKRSDVPAELTWNVNDIFPDDQAFQQGVLNLNNFSKQLSEHKETVVNSAKELLDTTKLLVESEELLGKVYGYAARVNDSDTGDARGNELYNTAMLAVNDWEAAISFYEPSITTLSEEQLKNFIASEPDLKQFEFNLNRIQAQKSHTLTPESEELLAKLQPAIDDAAEISTKLDDTDLKFGTYTNDDGQEVDLTKERVFDLQTNEDQKVREAVSRKMDEAYHGVRNTFAATLRNHVHSQNILAGIRHFDSARQMNLSENDVPESVYDSLIEANHKHLDLLHRYYELRKKVLGLNHMYDYDRHVSLVKGTKLKFTFDEAKAVAKKALKPLGPDYLAHLDDEFDHRWIDAAENEGKRSGGYEDDVYGVHPYILLNWSDTYSSTSTLVHESGHALQSVYTDLAQPSWYSQYPIFIAEIASTLNESLLNDYMVKQYADDPKVSAYLLTQILGDFVGTVYRQTAFAEFEHFIYTADAEGKTLTPDLMSDKFNGLFEQYNGPAVEAPDWDRDTWAYIPHFYYDYYVYQYATSKAIAVSLASDILNQKPGALDRYKEFLSAGASDYPINIVKKAGIDVTKTDYLDQAFDVFEDNLNQLEQKLNEL
ncbi:oligoendopeptidase F [Pediococcus argentinicus]|uniref:oligoendopeptidase F n=1 Tax=Pediococcus argentinicus TaxID=480391 RepID=UPI00338D50BE